MAAVAQGGYGVGVGRRPGHSPLVLGSRGGLAGGVLDGVQRTVGIPYFGPHAGVVEEVGMLGLAATVVEVTLVIALVASLRFARWPRASDPIQGSPGQGSCGWASRGEVSRGGTPYIPRAPWRSPAGAAEASDEVEALPEVRFPAAGKVEKPAGSDFQLRFGFAAVSVTSFRGPHPGPWRRSRRSVRLDLTPVYPCPVRISRSDDTYAVPAGELASLYGPKRAVPRVLTVRLSRNHPFPLGPTPNPGLTAFSFHL